MLMAMYELIVQCMYQNGIFILTMMNQQVTCVQNVLDQLNRTILPANPPKPE